MTEEEFQRELAKHRQRATGCELDAAVFRYLLGRALVHVPVGSLRDEIEDTLEGRSCGVDLAEELAEARAAKSPESLEKT